MSKVWSKIELVNHIAAEALQDSYDSLDQALQTDSGRKAVMAYDFTVERLLSYFPWPFATKRITLNKVSEKPISHWAYYYQLPEDYSRAWDVYTTSPTVRYPNSYEFSAYKGFFELDWTREIAVLEKNYLATNLESIMMYYPLSKHCLLYTSPSPRD